MEKLIEVGKATPEQIAKWKEEHKEILVIELKNKKANELCYGYLRKYKRVHVSEAYAKSAKEGLLAAGFYLKENLWIGGDPRLKSDELEHVDLAISADHKAASFIQFLEGEVKNL